MIFDSTGRVFWRIAWRNLVRNKRRHLLSGAALAFGFCGLILLGGYMLRMEQYLSVQSIYLNHTGHISIYKGGGLEKHLSAPSRYNISADEQRVLFGRLKRDEIEFVGKTLKGAALVGNGCSSFPVLITAVSSELQDRVQNHLMVKTHIPEIGQVIHGEGFWTRAQAANPINISPRLARDLEKSMVASEAPANRATHIIDCRAPDHKQQIAADPDVQLVSNSFFGGVAALDAEIAGHITTGFSLKDETSLMMPLESAQTFFQTDMITSVSIYLKDGVSASRFYKTIEPDMKELGFDTYLYDDPLVSQFYVGAMNFVYVMVGFFIFLVCSVVILSIVNALNISLLERKTEIATLRAIGYQPFTITQIFIRENFLLGLFSFGIGGLLAFGIKSAINAANWRFTIPGLADNLQFMLKPGLLFTFAVVVALMIVVEAATLAGCMRYMKQKITVLLAAA